MPLDSLLVVDDVTNKADPRLNDQEKAAATVCNFFGPLVMFLIVFVNQILDDSEIVLPILWVNEVVAQFIPVEEPVKTIALISVQEALLNQLSYLDAFGSILEHGVAVSIRSFSRLHGLEEEGPELRHSKEACSDSLADKLLFVILYSFRIYHLDSVLQ